jgi:hypothetical protein
MKRIVILLLVVSAALFLCVLSFFSAFRHRVEQSADLEVVQEGQAAREQAELSVAGENAPVAEQAVASVPKGVSGAESTPVAASDPGASSRPFAVPAVETALSAAKTDVSARPDAAAAKPSAGQKDAVVSSELAAVANPNPATGAVRPGATRENRSAVRTKTAAAGKAASASEEKTPAAKESVPENAGGAESYQYFEYQVITVPKKTLAAAAESAGLPKDSKPTDELLPAIYKQGGYRVIGYSAGYSVAGTPLEFKMSRAEFFPVFYILPKDPSEMSYDNGNDSSGGDEENDGSAEDADDGGAEDADGGAEDADGGDEDDGGEDASGDFMNTYNNLATIFPFFGDATLTGNEFYLDIHPPRIFTMTSTMRKLSGFSNTDYGDWGRGQSPVFDDNSFSNTLSATGGKPMIVALASSSNAWTMHVFFTQPQPMPEKTTPVDGSENKLVQLDFQIVRAKWNDICAAGNPDGSPAVPSEDFMRKLSASSQLRDFYSPSFRLVPSQEPVSIQLNAKTQFAPLKWIPGQDPGVPGIPLNNEPIWTGTSLLAAARILDEGRTVRLDYSFEKTTQTGWRNYQYSYYGDLLNEGDFDPQDRYARPQRQSGPDILSGTLKLPMLDTTAFRQTLYLEAGKPVLAARISNPAYQPDMLTLLFVTATVEDAGASE